MHVNEAVRTPQFWLLWGVLCLNVSAGIGVIGMASPMLQEVFGGRLIAVPLRLAELAEDQRAQVATIAAAFAGLLSLFNIAGRIFWASLSDMIGRKVTYMIFFLLGIALYVSAPLAGEAGRIAAFVTIFCVILTMYGGGFATIPAYLADLFGTQHVGAIHGRLLTAWSVAGIIGPVVGELHPRISACPRRAAGPGIQHHDVRARRDVARRPDLQCLHPAGQAAPSHDRRAARGRTCQGARAGSGTALLPRRRRPAARHC